MTLWLSFPFRNNGTQGPFWVQSLWWQGFNLHVFMQKENPPEGLGKFVGISGIEKLRFRNFQDLLTKHS